EGWYLDWSEYERHRLQTMYVTMLYTLMGYCEAHQQYEAGLSYGHRVLGYDRACERTHRRLMRLHYRSGDRTAALRQFERCSDALREELDAQPSQRTQMLFEQIRADLLDEVPEVRKPSNNRDTTVAVLAENLNKLKHLLSTLGDTQRQVQQQVQTIEQ